MKKQLIAIGAGLAGAAAGTLLALAYRDFSREKRAAGSRLQTGIRVVLTPRGPVEVAESGNGPAVLVLHGGGGGFDQSLAFADPQAGFHWICPSRPGYLHTPLETGRTPEQQADAFAALLDTLHIEKTAVFAMSGGGPVGIQFALRYPDRCWGLVLLSAFSQPETSFLPLTQLVLNTFVYTDFIPWLFINTQLMVMLSGPRFKRQLGASPEKWALLNSVRRSMFPLDVRAAGLLNDLEQVRGLRGMPLNEIHLPTLVIHGAADSIVPLAQGVYSANAISGAKFIVFPDGGHLAYITHLEQSRPALLDFLRKHAPG